MKPILKKIEEETKNNEEIIELGKKLLPLIPFLFEGIQVTPCLIHGDINPGNWKLSEDGNSLIMLDPACFYAHSEVELGSMSVWRNFDPEFLSEYRKFIPEEPGFQQRMILYRLFYLLSLLYAMGPFRKRQKCILWMQELLDYVEKKSAPKEIKENDSKEKIILVYNGSFCPIHLK
jgi:fructosamine-3-kinase